MMDGATTTQASHAAPPASTQPELGTWSTEMVKERERFSYWREAVTSKVYGISIDAASESFSAWITGRASGPFRFAMSESTGYAIARSRREIENGPSDLCSIYLQLSGQTVSERGGETAIFTPNDIGIFDGRQSFRAWKSGCRAIAVLPRAMIDQRAPWLQRQPCRRLSAGSPFADLIRSYVLKLNAADSTLNDAAISVLADNLCNVIALATAEAGETGRLPADVQIEAMLLFCRQNLHKSELSPQLVADRLGISLRTLHSRFQQIGQSFGRWVLENRLEACSAALRDRNQRDMKISEIAYRWGFNDLSYFNKAFRARYDRKPREWRSES